MGWPPNRSDDFEMWKFKIPFSNAFEHEMPSGAKVLYVDVQGSEPFFWARVAVRGALERRPFYLRGTGQTLPADAHYLGSFQIDGFVGHLLEP